ncbi:bacillithiol biosynthesis BshC, partial [Staphylococcus haemolyticus]
GLPQARETDTDVHFVVHDDGTGHYTYMAVTQFKLSKSDITYSEEELIELIETEPERFSNNVVTRPVMEEWLFNTVAFIGGPSEIKYWAELNNVFKLLNVEMPIVLPRMKMTYMMERTQKLLKQYSLNVEKVIQNGIDDDKNEFV